jgi:PAS domain S-box-containing protein
MTHSSVVSRSTGEEQQETRSDGTLVADIIIANAPDPVFVSDLDGNILQANDAVFVLLGFRPDELIEQSLSRIISAEETREFTTALREVVARGVIHNARLNPRSASGEVIPTTLNASALRDPNGRVIGAIGILRDMRAYERVVRNLDQAKAELQEQLLDLRIISAEKTREFTAALREVVARGGTRNASGEVIPTTLNASALRDPNDQAIGAIGVLRDMRAYERVVRDLEQAKAELQEQILDIETFEEVVVGRELKMIALERELEKLTANRTPDGT